jgi:preprotein translocase subunit SecA
LFASDRIASIMERLKIPDDVPIEAKIVSRAIERAQTQVESMNFEIRKNVLKYDEVMDKQRHIIYDERRQILEGEDFRDQAIELVTSVVEAAVAENANPDLHPEEWDWETLFARMQEIYASNVSRSTFDIETTTYEEVVDTFVADALAVYEQRERDLGTEQMRQIERLVLLNVIDNRWREHLYEMDYLQEGIGLRAMGQKDPLVEYQREGFDMFQRMQDTIKEDFARYIFHVELVRDDDRRRREPAQMRRERRQIPLAAATAGPSSDDQADDEEPAVQQARSEKIPRNAPCPCGSGKKYKLCHGRPGVASL